MSFTHNIFIHKKIKNNVVLLNSSNYPPKKIFNPILHPNYNSHAKNINNHPSPFNSNYYDPPPPIHNNNPPPFNPNYYCPPPPFHNNYPPPFKPNYYGPHPVF